MKVMVAGRSYEPSMMCPAFLARMHFVDKMIFVNVYSKKSKHHPERRWTAGVLRLLSVKGYAAQGNHTQSISRVRYHTFMRSFHSSRGVSLVDVLVGSALVLIIFLGIFGVIRASLAVSSLAKLKNTATAIATTRMEYIRSLQYDAVGTVGGIPSGAVPQYATTTLEGVDYVTRVYIEYADDPGDGEGGADENGIITDYKHVKVSTSYAANGKTRAVTLVSNVAPPGIETTAGGGTLRIEVVDALGAPVPGASVRVKNASTSPTIDVTTFSSLSGIVYLPGAATSTQYEVYVSKDGYSSAQTYPRDATNANPTPGYLTVVGNTTTASTFAIDLLGTLTLRTFLPIAASTTRDSLDSNSGIRNSASVSVSGGALTLSGTPGSYPSSGEASSVSMSPAYLASWTSASSTVSLPPGASALLRIEDASGNLLSDAVLPGNSAGFTDAINLSGVSTTTYPALALRVSLSSSDPNVTPSVLDWELGYEAGPTPLANVPFSITGAKTIGSTAGGSPIFKTVIATSTDASGVRTLTLEWDSYQLSLSGYTILSQSPESPYELAPGATLDASLILFP